MSRKLSTINPSLLVAHPLSVELYGDVPDERFIASIKARGIDEPIVVAADGKTIISGVRRMKAAIEVGMSEVPIIIRKDLVDRLDIEEAIIEANRHHEQSNECKARAFTRLLAIEEERAAIRRNATLKQNASPSGPQVRHTEHGRAADKAAEAVGVSRTTAERSAKVVEKIDEAKASGKVTTEADLRKTLNESVKKAHEVAVPSDRYQAAFAKLPRSVIVLIKETPSIASERCVLKMATMGHDELGQIARSVRIGDVKRFDDVVKPSKNGASSGKAKQASRAKPAAEKPAAKPADKPKAPAKPPAKQTAKQFADALIKDHVRPLAKGLDQLSKMNGGKGSCHKRCMAAMNDAIGFFKSMGCGER